MSGKLRAIYHPAYRAEPQGFSLGLGTVFIGVDDGEHIISEISVELICPAPSRPRDRDGYFASMNVHHDGIATLRKLDESGFLDVFAKIEASTFYDVLQCLSVAGIGLMSHDSDSLEYTSRMMYELLHKGARS